MVSATPNLEKVIRDLAARGEISHISLSASGRDGKLWRASYSMCSTFGVNFAEDADPAQALVLALTTAKLKKPRAKIDLKATRVEPTEDIADDLM